jgi:hypothetical protein
MELLKENLERAVAITNTLAQDFDIALEKVPFEEDSHLIISFGMYTDTRGAEAVRIDREMREHKKEKEEGPVSRK